MTNQNNHCYVYFTHSPAIHKGENLNLCTSHIFEKHLFLKEESLGLQIQIGKQKCNVSY